MSDNKRTLVHVKVDGSRQEARNWLDYLRDYNLEGYEFVVTRDDDVDTHTVVDRDELVADIADAVVERLGGESDE